MLSRSRGRAAKYLSCQLIPCSKSCCQLLVQRRLGASIRFNSSTEDAERETVQHPRRAIKAGNRINSARKPRSEKAVLDVDFLGQPGQIVLLPNQKRRRKRSQNSTSQEDNRTTDTLPFMLRELDNEERPLDNAGLRRRIEKFRSNLPPGHKFNSADWEELRSSLQQSFTFQQLSDYIAVNLREQLPHSETEQTSRGWKPGTSLFLETNSASPPRIANRIAKAQHLAGKDILAETILRDCWQFGVGGEVGQLDACLPPHFITLLLNSENFSFEELAGLHEATIDVVHDPGLIRITGNQQACESIGDIIQDTMARIQEKNVRLPQNEKKIRNLRFFTPDFMEWVGKTYGVVCHYNARSGFITIYYLAENKQGADEARRALHLAVYDRKPSNIPFCTYFPGTESAEAHKVSLEDKASWFDRQKPWFRWATSALVTEPATRSIPFFANHQTGVSGEFLKLLRSNPPSYLQKQGRHKNREKIIAVVGKCMFMHDPKSFRPTLNASELGEMALPRAFIYDIPRATAFLRLLRPFPYTEYAASYHVRLLPSSFTGQAFPVFDVEVEVEPTNSSLVVRSVKAILEENSVDYLLPENGLDLRFTRLIYRELLDEAGVQTSGLGVHFFLQSIHTCANALLGVLRPDSGQNSPPAFYHLNIPRDLLQQLSKRDAGSGARSTSPSQGYVGEDQASLEYIVLPLKDIRGSRLYHYEFRGERLNYSFRDSGPVLPSRMDHVSLSMDLTEDFLAPPNDMGKTFYGRTSSADLVAREFNIFYGNACELAFELDKGTRQERI